jgi:hypothetical protein
VDSVHEGDIQGRVVAGTKSGIKNGPYSIEEARLGPQGIGYGTAGKEFFDHFFTWQGRSRRGGANPVRRTHTELSTEAGPP